MDTPNTPVAAPDVPTPTNTGRVTFKFTGDGLEMALLMLKNLFFTIITLGIYRAWATTNVRRYVWGHTTFLDDRANYTGTGEELFKGWIKLIGLLIGMAVIVRILEYFIPFAGLAMIAVYAVIFGLATYSGLRYRLSRTQWRQVRFGAEKNKELTQQFLKLYIAGWVLSIITLGIYVPWFKNDTRQFLTKRSRLGNMHFDFDGDGSTYAAIYFKGLLFTVITFGIYTPWWIRNLAEYRWTHTSFMGHRFGFDLSGKDLLIFFVCAYLATIFTLGIAGPWMFVWGLKLFADHTYLNGTPDFAQVVAAASDGSALADDIVDGYDLDLGF